MQPMIRTALRMGLAAGARYVWAAYGPRGGADLRASRPVPDEVRRGEVPPAPDQLLGHTTKAVGRLADTDPLVAPPWPRRRGGATVVALLAGLSALRVRRDLAAAAGEATTPRTPTGTGA